MFMPKQLSRWSFPLNKKSFFVGSSSQVLHGKTVASLKSALFWPLKNTKKKMGPPGSPHLGLGKHH
jgi:hypothetical protein